MSTVEQPVQKKRRRVNLLNLPAWEIPSSKETAGDHEITARPANPPTTCPFCGKAPLLRYGTDAQVIHAEAPGLVAWMGKWK